MKKYFILVIILHSSLFAQTKLDRNAQPHKAVTSAFSVPSTQSFELKNGLKVLIIPKKTVPLVDMEVLFQAGTNKETFNKAGVAGLASQMLFMGTTTRSAPDIADELNRLGIAMYSSSNYEYSQIISRCSSENIRQALDVLADIAIHPIFPDTYINIFKQQSMNTCEGQLREPMQTASLVFYAQIFGSRHPYGRSISGTFASIDSLRRSDVENFYSSFYRPNNATLIISGDVDPNAVMKVIHDRFDEWIQQPIPSAALPDFPMPDSVRILVIHDSSATMAQVRIGHLSTSRNSQQFIPSIVMNQILGGDVISRLNMNLWMQKKISPTFRTMFGFHKDIGFFAASGSCPADSVTSAIDAVIQGLYDMMQKKVSAGELQYGQNSLIKSYELEFETNAQLLRKIQDCLVFGLPFDTYNTYVSKIQSLKAEDVETAAQILLDPAHITIVIVGNANMFYDQLYKKYKDRIKVMNPASEKSE